MKLSLTIDQGNSSAKMSVFDGDEMIYSERCESRLTADDIADLLAKFDVGSAIYSSVIGNDKSVTDTLEKATVKTYIVDENIPLPITIGYSTPHTLGHDRIAAAVGAISLYPECNILIVDSGTAITYDVVTADKHFIGGNIAPGISTRFSALSHYCAQLPLINADGDTPLVGYDTATAIRSGVVLGVIAEVKYLSDSLKRQYGDITLLLTGGDSGIIATHLTDGTRVELDDNLVTIGLNRILQYNEQL